jgi:hypothetical protein
MEEQLQKRVKGQEAAISSICKVEQEKGEEEDGDESLFIT